jgi:hypothetical protein
MSKRFIDNGAGVRTLAGLMDGSRDVARDAFRE